MKEPTQQENKIAEKVLDAAFIVHRELGPDLLESRKAKSYACKIQK